MEASPIIIFLATVACIALIWMAFSLNSIAQKLRHLGIVTKGQGATTGATGGTPPKVGGPHGDE